MGQEDLSISTVAMTTAQGKLGICVDILPSPLELLRYAVRERRPDAVYLAQFLRVRLA